MSEAERLLRAWRDDLASWAIPKEILDRAPAAPWTTERAVFVRRAADRRLRPDGTSYTRAREALPEGGSVLDVGAGAGAASLPLIDRAAGITAIDQDGELLRALIEQAGANGPRVRTIIGAWPAAATAVATADIVVCHHVLYNVADLRPFIEALATHARRRVVIEITAAHPVARLNPLWLRFHGLARPERPTWKDAVAAIEAVAGEVQAERERRRPDGASGDWAELVALTSRRLCLGPERQADVAAALTELLGARPEDPATWSAPNREIATIWWDPASSG